MPLSTPVCLTFELIRARKRAKPVVARRVQRRVRHRLALQVTEQRARAEDEHG
jgi:hypothetical protein